MRKWCVVHFELLENGFSFLANTVSNDVFGAVAATNTTIDLTNGLVPVGTDLHAGFAVHAANGGTFTVREMASVPEPSTFALLAFGAIGFLGAFWRHRRR